MRRNLLRHRAPGREERVGVVETFFDLVFVYAITQVSHTLIGRQDALGFLQAGMLFLAVWWVWIYTAWVTNWLDVRRLEVRLLLFALMIVSMLLAISMPRAFGDRALLFALSYIGAQAGRALFMIFAFSGHRDNQLNFVRIFSWSLIEAPFWIAGALVYDPQMQLWWWLAALAIITIGPFLNFWMPVLGRSDTRTWNVEAHHMAERCGLFIIIALGESVVLTGSAFGAAEWTSDRILAFASAFLGTIAMWWLYFDVGAERSLARFAALEEPGAMARLAYTYLHIPIVAGIILWAAADDLVLVEPRGPVSNAMLLMVIGGPAVYLAGNLLFKGSSANNRPLSHWVGLGLLAVLVPLGRILPPLHLLTAAMAILVLVAVWEAVSLRDTRRHLYS
jgi:low temperature requirement protein LtrA